MQRISLLVVLAAGCGNLLKLVPHEDTSIIGSEGRHITVGDAVYRVGPYWGPACEAINAQTKQVYQRQEAVPTSGPQPDLTHEPTEQILRLVCVEEIVSSEDRPSTNTWVAQHFRFDELSFDHATAAEMLVQCLKADSCLREGAPPHNTGEPPKRRHAYQDYEIGMMRWYADHVDPNQVAAKIATYPGLPAEAQQVYLAELEKAKTRVIAVTDELDFEAKQLFVDLPASVYNHRNADHARYGKVLAQLELLATRVRTERAGGTTGVADDTVTKLRDLRLAYRASCKGDCTHDVIFAAITQQLFWAYVSRGDSAAAMAESRLLEHPDPTAQQEIADKQVAAITKASGRSKRVAEARGQGLDTETARSTANGKVLDLGDGDYIYRYDGKFSIFWRSLVPDVDDVEQIGGTVAGMERRGANVLVRFQDEVGSTTEDTDCHETNRVDGIDSSGKLIYREKCTGSVTHVDRTKVLPVTMPANEVAGVRAGEEILGYAKRTGKAPLGRVWMVKRGERVARLREMAL